MPNDDHSYSSGDDTSTSSSSLDERKQPTQASRAPLAGEEADSGEESEAVDDEPDDASSTNYSDKDSEHVRKMNFEPDSGTVLGEKHVPLAERIHRREQQGSLDLREKRQRKMKAREIVAERLQVMQNDSTKSKAKKSKHAPTEASSKKADFFKNRSNVIVGTGVDLGANRYQPRDPRASSLHGHLQVDHFAQNYEFIQSLRTKEINSLKQRLKAWKTPGRKGQDMRRKLGLTSAAASMEKDKEELKRLQQEKVDWERQQTEREAKKSVKKKLQEMASQSGKVYFPKRRELRQMEDEAKLNEIRKRKGDGAVEKVLAKRRKKSKSRDSGLVGK